MKHLDFTSLEVWLHGLGAAALSAIGVTGTDYLASLMDNSQVNWHHLGVILGVTSIGAAFLYLRQTPLPNVLIQGPGTMLIPNGQTAAVTLTPSDSSSTNFHPEIPRPSNPPDKK